MLKCTWTKSLIQFRPALVAVVPKAKLTINGPVKTWTGTADSGNKVDRIFCSECGSPIAHDPSAAPDIIALKAGTLDTEIKKNLKPVSSIALESREYLFLTYRKQDTEIWTAGKLPFCQEHLAKPFKFMPE